VHPSRFELRGTLGTGGAGVVHRAFDRELGREVALKVLRQASGRDLYRFKREFRALADLIHPNLVALHELFADGDEWYFTMELVEGVGFIDWVRPSAWPTAGVVRGRPDIIAAPLDVDRLRAALVQLVDALVALHACGKLHRDLKPSNVLVTDAGRVVLLDFGLVSEQLEQHPEHLAVGTPVYMSPEQAADHQLTAASDWYGLGVMLYEALSGRRPFEGAAEQVMRRKQSELPLAPRTLAPGIPDDLERLCLALLRAAPADRPDGPAILAWLGAAPSPSTREMGRATLRGPFVGRQRELDSLRRALSDCRRHGVAVFVHGATGIGKSALVRRFLDEVAAEALVLEGRCYERESVPYKLLDTVVDSLATVLVGFEPDELAAVLPRELPSLARLFPVLRRVPRIAELIATAPTPPDPLELRQRAFGALRYVLSRLARRRIVIVSVDDLHWGDPDSAVFLVDVVHHPEPAVLFVFAHAPEDDAGVIDQIRRPASGVRGADLRDVIVGPLADAEAHQLVREIAGGAERADEVVPQGAGSPLLLTELARSNLAAGATIEAVVGARVERLAPGARLLLIAVSVANAPVPLEVAAAAAGIVGGHTEAALLSSERLARIRRIDGTTAVEPSHAHVSRAIADGLDAANRAAWHAALAAAYASAGPTTPQIVVDHWLAAGEPGHAAAHAVPAAAQAEDALAFRRAGELYELALAHGEWDRARRCDLLRRRGHALACAGQLDASAEAYGAAAALAEGDDTVELARLQIEQLLRCGRLDDGLAVAQRVLHAVGLDLPLAARVPGRRRGATRPPVKSYDFVERLAPALELRRVDILYSLASGLQFVDPWLGRVVQDELIRAALAAGEPFRVCLALGQELAYLAGAGPRLAREVELVGEKLRATAMRVGHPHVIGVADAAIGMAAFLAGNLKEAKRYLRPALATLRDHGTDVRWEIDVAELYLLSALYYLGELREVARIVPIMVREANERGDRFAQLALHSWRPNVAWLIADRPAIARANLGVGGDDAADDASYVVQRYFRLHGDVQIDLYVGDGAAAWRRIEAGWPALDRSRMLRRQVMRIEAMSLRGRAALAGARAAEGKDRAELIRVARTLGDELVGEDVGWAVGQGELLRGLAALSAGHPSAADDLARAEAALVRADMAAWALAARLRRAQATGGAQGMARVEAARDALRDLGAADPDAFVRLLAPIADP
jgi:tRNA A-37 threonylcarbamoyl transferase component Bud32